MSFEIRSVRSRYILTGFAICAVSLLLVSLSSYLISFRITSGQMEACLRESALRSAAELDRWFGNYGDLVGGIAEDIEIVKNTDPAFLLRLLKGKLRIRRENILDLYFGYSDPRKPFLSAVDWVPDGSYDCRKRPWFLRAQWSDSTVFTEPYVDAQTGAMVITIARRVRKAGRLVGVLAADIRISRVVDIVRRYRIGEGGYAFLLDGQGDFVSHPCGELQPRTEGLTNVRSLPYGGYTELLDSFADGAPQAREMRDRDGREAYFLLSRVPSNGWFFGVSLPREDYRKPLRSLMAGFVLAFLLSMLLGALIMLRLVAGMVRPIRSLTETIRAFSGGDLDARTKVESEDEIGELGRAFNGMADTIREYRLFLERKVEERTRELREKNDRIRESIEYARTLQEAILPGREALDAILRDHFVLWEPRDTVSGDFYWLRACGDGFLLVLGDCTGHGVPGALMTMAAKALLDRIVTEEAREDPAAILERLDVLLDRTLLREGERNVQDGLDAGVLFVDRERRTARFAGAGLSLLVVDRGEEREIRGYRYGLGSRSLRRREAFALQELELPVGAILYLATDGIRDQIGGEMRVPFGRKRLGRLLASLWDRPMEEQREVLLRTLAEYRGGEAVRDDVTLVGVRI
jgi:serine phosphatase RsbU (regulator of sigma subunit)/HAMP domain-containing protein